MTALFLLSLSLSLWLVGCAPQAQPATRQDGSESPYTSLVADFRNTDLGCGWEPIGGMDLNYAQCYAVDYYDGGFSLICIADGGRYLVVPEGADPPSGLAADIQVLRQPVRDIYLAASDTMCLFDALDSVGLISVSGIERDDWYVQAARDAMDAGRIVYGGKYRAPDYELLASKEVRLAIESTMINHTPEVREKLMDLGIPVLTELSSYESEPLGRAEWVRLYGLLCGKDDLAQKVFDEQVSQAESFSAEPTGKTVAFFYLNANGSAVVRRPGDYVTNMIEKAGGRYAFSELEQAKAGSSSMTMEMERFYVVTKDADILIYNATIDEPLSSVGELVQKNELLADFKAVREGNVWLCDQNMYQQMVAAGDIMAEMNRMFCGETEDMTFFRRLA